MIHTRLLRLCIAAALTCGSAAAAHAGAPMVKTQAPGYYRMMLGDFEITALSDGTVMLPVNQLLSNTTPDRVDRTLARAGLRSPLETSVNAYLINTGDKLVLVDSGAAGLFGPTLGKLAGNLKAAGYQPEQVDEIYLTHMHPDHVGGLAVDGRMAFPNAIVRAARADADYWLSNANLSRAKKDDKASFEGAMTSLHPYIEAQRFRPFEGRTPLTAGISALPRPGHTVGHTTYLVESRGQSLVLWGDLVHVAAVQFDSPAVTIVFDSNARTAATQRKLAYADAATHGYLVAGAHLSFPGIGRVRPNGRGYTWLPVDYTIPK
jgi:glyoxylase-like metal-dependent hydrolase (beta-lactamase superfamily II)